MSKYKVGDRVHIKQNLCEGRTSDGLMVWDDMVALAGKEVEILNAFIGGLGEDRYRISGSSFNFSNDCFSGLAKPEPKFKVGDEVVGNEKANRYGATRQGWKGAVTCVREQRFDAMGHDNARYNEEFCWLDYDWFDLVKPSSKILITTDGTTTTARLYENEKVIKSAQAKCAPGDTFDFAIGAGLAYGRLMHGGEAFKAEKVEADKPKPEKREYRVGDKVKVIANTCGHHVEIGKEVTLTGRPSSGVPEHNRPAWEVSGHYGYVSDRDIEPYTAEPDLDKSTQKEPIKLYCIKDYEPGEWITKGKIYELDDDGTIHFDDGYKLNYPETKIHSPRSSVCKNLIPLVKRPAKVGEWVYITSEDDSESGDLHVGDISPVVRNCDERHAYVRSKCKTAYGLPSDGNVTFLLTSQYLVLDGYTPKDDTKPESAKIDIVCPCCGVRIVQDEKGASNGKT